VCSIIETEVLWHAFNEDCDSLVTKLTAAERDLSHLKVKETTFQQMKDSILPRLKVTHAKNCLTSGLGFCQQKPAKNLFLPYSRGLNQQKT